MRDRFERRDSGRGGPRGGSRFGGRDRQAGGFRDNPPVKVGDELDVTIESVAEKGDGVAKKDGFVLFVPGTKVGDKVKIRVTKVLRNLGFAEVIGSAGEGSGEEASGAEESEESSYESEEEPKAEDSEDFGEESEEPQESEEEEKYQA